MTIRKHTFKFTQEDKKKYISKKETLWEHKKKLVSDAILMIGITTEDFEVIIKPIKKD